MIPTKRSAFSLVEAAISILLVSVVIVAALNTVGAAKVGRQKNADRARGTLLAQDLMSEILLKAYEEPIDSVNFGRETGESGSHRAEYDDVDDYDGWSASPPQDADRNDMTYLAGWERTVSVVFTDGNDVTGTAVSDLGVKRVTVTVTAHGVPVGEIIAVKHKSPPE